MDYVSHPSSPCRSVFISIISTMIESMFIDLVHREEQDPRISMIMIEITILIVILISMIAAAVALCSLPSPRTCSPRERRRGRARARERSCSSSGESGAAPPTRERERKGRQLSRAAGQKCAHGGGEHRQSHSRALLRPGLEVRLWSSGEGSDKRLVSHRSKRREHPSQGRRSGPLLRSSRPPAA